LDSTEEMRIVAYLYEMDRKWKPRTPHITLLWLKAKLFTSQNIRTKVMWHCGAVLYIAKNEQLGLKLNLVIYGTDCPWLNENKTKKCWKCYNCDSLCQSLLTKSTCSCWHCLACLYSVYGGVMDSWMSDAWRYCLCTEVLVLAALPLKHSCCSCLTSRPSLLVTATVCLYVALPKTWHPTATTSQQTAPKCSARHTISINLPIWWNLYVHQQIHNHVPSTSQSRIVTYMLS